MTEPGLNTELAAIAQRFRSFAKDCASESPLYERLSLCIAEDAEILRLAADPRRGQPIANLFFAAIHYLIVRHPTHPLGAFYRTLSVTPEPPSEAFVHFRTFCLEHREQIQPFLADRLVQTNEVRRCSYLLPALCHLSALADHRPLALVEIGASAGLNLLWDYYSYDYGDSAIQGDPDSRVRITSTFCGANRPQFTAELPKISSRIGVDLSPVNVLEQEDVNWLLGLVWPEQDDRRDLLAKAIAIAQQKCVNMVAGDGMTCLPAIVAGLPVGEALCVMHTHTLNQFSAVERDRFKEMLAAESFQQTLYELSCEWIQTLHPELVLTTWQQGRAESQLLAYCDHHGRWIEWLRSAD